MKKKLFGCFATMLGIAVMVSAQKPPMQRTDHGKIDRHYIYSPEMRDTITVDVWMPRGYDASGMRKYPVIYMHDGQNLYDASTTWNHQSWEMDSVAQSLIDAGDIQAPVIVGVHSVQATRLGDLMPQKAAKSITPPYSGEINNFLKYSEMRGDAYAAFIVNTLRNEINAEYAVAQSPDSTFVMGSSMGGLMSIYAMSEYPEVFGGAGCMSTHWIGTTDGDDTFGKAMYAYLEKSLPTDCRHKIYLDRGTESLDSLYGLWNGRMIQLMQRKGYAPEGEGCGSVLYAYIHDGGAHEERSWAARVAIPLRFLLGK